VNILTINFRAN